MSCQNTFCISLTSSNCSVEDVARASLSIPAVIFPDSSWYLFQYLFLANELFSKGFAAHAPPPAVWKTSHSSGFSRQLVCVAQSVCLKSTLKPISSRVCREISAGPANLSRSPAWRTMISVPSRPSSFIVALACSRPPLSR